MAWQVSIRNSTRFASIAIVCALVRDHAVRACVGGDETIIDITAFDPKVIGDATWDGLFFDPFSAGFGGACDECIIKAMLADWHGYLAGAVGAEAWERVLFTATLAELDGLDRYLAGIATSPPAGFETWRDPTSRGKLRAAIAYVTLARKLEGLTTLEPHSSMPGDLLADAKAGLKAAADPFLAQRYAFLVLRVEFYQRMWVDAIAFYDHNAATLAKPSDDLAWRSRHYLAGALRRSGNRARANLELARIHAGYRSLSGAAAFDFQPMEEADWKKTLALAKDDRERAMLWRLAGVKTDGLVALDEILKLDPRSNLAGVLVVRELARAESSVNREFGTPSPTTIAAQKKAFALLERLATKIAKTPGADRPWLMELVLGHIAARRGDVVGARVHLQLAVTARPADKLVANQANASLALAMAVGWKMNPHDEDELAHAMHALTPDFGRAETVRKEIRQALAQVYLRAGRSVEAEFLFPGTVGPLEEFTRQPIGGPSLWQQASFVRDMIVRTGRTATEFDRFVLDASYTRDQLETELALRFLLDGDFTAAAGAFRTSKAVSAGLGTDPFVVHIIDCHDCDHDKYAKAPWTHKSLVDKLVELERTAKGTGEPAAEAALALGNALYNVTWYGNARSVLANTHQQTKDTAAAERWYRRAYELTKNRELKAKAAYLAAKAELGGLITRDEQDQDVARSRTGLPTPTTWFNALKAFPDTRYYQEVLAECGNFRAFVK
jgi:hypothetical protein